MNSRRSIIALMNTTKKWLNSKSKKFFVILLVVGITLYFLSTVARGPVSRDASADIAHKARLKSAPTGYIVARGPVPRNPRATVARGPVPRDASADITRRARLKSAPTGDADITRRARLKSAPTGDAAADSGYAIADSGPAVTADSRASTDEENLILIPAGTFTMGSERRAADEKPMHKVYLDAYYIGKYEVTNAEYYAFWVSDASRRQTPENFAHLPHIGEWPARAKQFPNHPIVGVSWHDAKAYAEWRGMRLPTEAEWEKAARGYTDRTWPWGNAMEPYANTSAAEDGYENQLAPVGSFPKGKSYYGALDMAGNVWEWTADWYSDVYYWRSLQANNNASRSAKRNPPGPDVGSWRVIRGGSYIDALPRCSTTFRFYLYPRLKTSFVGFRLAKTAEKTSRIYKRRQD
ncbi:hypothetical protein C6495_02170 [Candidatus Poribacteria bacterium]|nr:MAG: hypothetical protein C6495_02170 [Candidatus Poribacteria bacterium]